ncbi:MAG: hypothetical protein ABL857_07290 [Rickettsiales bacterium]
MEHIEKIREAVGIFDNYDEMEKTIEELQIAGIGRRHISVLGSQTAVEKKFGSAHVKTKMLADHPDAPRSPDIRQEELGIGQGALISGGLFVGVVTAVILSGGLAVPGIVTTAVIGGAGGAMAGGLLAVLLGEKYAEFFQSQIDEGGLLLWVNTPNAEMESKVQKILKNNGARNVHIHELLVNDNLDNNNYPDRQSLNDVCVKLDQLVVSHHKILSSDQMMRSKLSEVLQTIKKEALKEKPASDEFLSDISSKIEKAVNYAQDMAEEEQRLIAETMASGTGKQEIESELYYAIASDLRKTTKQYQREMAEAN